MTISEQDFIPTACEYLYKCPCGSIQYEIQLEQIDCMRCQQKIRMCKNVVDNQNILVCCEQSTETKDDSCECQKCGYQVCFLSDEEIDSLINNYAVDIATVQGQYGCIHYACEYEEQEVIEQQDEQQLDEYQLIENAFKNSDKHLQINAYAGCGKSTTELKLAQKFSVDNQKWLYLVFNTDNREEAKQKFPKSVDIHTTNSFLGQQLQSKKNREIIGTTQLSLELSQYDEFKYLQFGRQKIEYIANLLLSTKRIQKKDVKQVSQNIVNMACLMKAYSVNPKDKQQFEELFNKIIVSHKIKFNFTQVYRQLIHTLLENCLPKTSFIVQCKTKNGVTEIDLQNYRDFEDDLWYSSLMNISFNKYDVVLLDEVQDFNICQVNIVQKLSQNGSRIIYVGDKFQSIYSFRGATGMALEQITQRLGQENVVNLKLTKNYRSRKNIVEYVNHNSTIVTDLKQGNFINQDQGIVQEIARDNLLSHIKTSEQTAIISRKNSDLFRIVIKLITKRIDFVYQGKDVLGSINSIINNVCYSNYIKTSDKISVLRETLTKTLNNDDQNFDQDQLETIACIIELIDYKKDITINSFKTWLQRDIGKHMVDNGHCKLVLTTIHKSKGMQYPIVYYIDQDKIEESEDYNTQYIAFTRAIDQLYIVKCD